MVFRPFWVARLHVSERTAEKLASKHGLRTADLRDEVVCRRGLGARENRDPERGVRLYVDVVIQGAPVLVVLKRHQHQVDEYYLVSAYRV